MSTLATRAEPAEIIDREIAAAATTLERHLPPFRYEIRWVKDYDALIQGNWSGRSDVDGLLKAALDVGRVIVSARGGGGKSSMLTQLFDSARAANVVPIIVDLKRWTPPDYAAWDSLGYDQFRRMSFLLDRFASPRFSALRLDGMSPSTVKLLMVDGLNEINSGVGAGVIAAADEFAGTILRLSIVVCDRLVRRSLPNPRRWCIGSVMLAEGEVMSALRHATSALNEYAISDSVTKALLELPFFLDEAVQLDRLPTTMAATQERYLQEHAGLTLTELNAAAIAGFNAYAINRSRTFRLADFQTAAGHIVTKKLLAAAVLTTDGEIAHFSHHLQHDYLAARALAGDPGLWTFEALNTVTFDASSFDVLVMALEQIREPTAADQFVLALYDFNLYATGYTIGEAAAHGRSAVTKLAAQAVFAALAEKRFDLVIATAQRAEDALSLSGSPIAEEFRQARTMTHLVGMVLDRSGAGWTREWGQVFAGTTWRGRPIVPAAISDVNAIIAWTASNTLKRVALGTGQIEELITALRTGERIVRWRAAHTLGGHPTEGVADALAEAVTDEWEWVRYGAVRSLVEVAALGTPELRHMVYLLLVERAERLRQDSMTLSEFKRAILIDPARAPSDWEQWALDLVDLFYQRASDVDESDRWRTLAYEVRTLYRR